MDGRPAATSPCSRQSARREGRTAKRRKARRPRRRSASGRPTDPARSLGQAPRADAARADAVRARRAGVRCTGSPSSQRVHDPTSELVLTILSQNSADVNAEKAFESLRRALSVDGRGDPEPRARSAKLNRPGWGGVGLDRWPPPDWAAVEEAPLARTDRGDPAGRPRAARRRHASRPSLRLVRERTRRPLAGVPGRHAGPRGA